MRKYLIGFGLIFAFLAVAGPSSNRTIVATFIKDVGGTHTLTLPAATDTLVARATTDTLTNKTMDGATNTWTNIPASTALTGQAAVPNGGTGLASGTAAGILYFPTTTTLASSGALTAHGVVVSEGTSAPVTVTSSAAGQVLQLNGASSDPTVTATPTLGVNGTTSGILSLATSAGSGASISIENGGATSAYTIMLPTTLCTLGQGLVSSGSSGSAWTCASPLTNNMSTLGDFLYGGAAGASTRLAGPTAANLYMMTETGTGSAAQAPVWQQLLPPTIQRVNATPAVAGYIFSVSASAAGVASGCVYSSNSQNFTVLTSVTTGATLIWMTGTGTPSASGTLTYVSGGGSACNGGSGTNLTMAATTAFGGSAGFDNTVFGYYTVPSTAPLYIDCTITGAGGGGGGSGTSQVTGNYGMSSYFGSNSTVVVGGGTGGTGGNASNNGDGGAGGTAATSGVNTILSFSGQSGAPPSYYSATAGGEGGMGGSNLTSGGGKGATYANNGSNGVTNTGGGGGGAGGTASAEFAGGGGGAGAAVRFTINNPTPSANYPLVIGTGGTGGAGSVKSGGNGAAGQLVCIEHYQ